MVIRVLRKKELEFILEQAPPFPRPQRHLEQYPTDSYVASEVLWYAYMRGDVEGKRVIDLGCGTGKLCIGAAALGAQHCVCIDIDELALKELLKWSRELGLHDIIDTVQADVNYTPLRDLSVDTTIMNPPFGVYRRGADVEFVRSASRISRTIYSIHKKSPGLLNVLLRVAHDCMLDFDILFELTMKIPQIYETHIKRVHNVEVVIVRFIRRNSSL